MRGRGKRPYRRGMLRLLPIALLLLLFAAPAQAATVKVPVPADGQVTVAVAKVGTKAKVKAKAPGGIAVLGSAKKGRLGVAVVHRRGIVAGGSVTLTVKGKVRGLKIGGAPACKGLGSLLSKPLVRGGLGASDLRALGAATAAKVCGKPFSQALLDRLGLGTPPPTSGSITTPGRPKPPAGGGSTNQCSNGVDDDADGQVDAASERELRPDPGCMNANDSSEAGEVPLNCNAGAGVGEDPSQLQIGINEGCGSFVEVAVYASPSPFVCDIAASAGNWVCVIAHGQPWAEARNAVQAEMADLTIGLNGPADCTVPVTIALTRSNLDVAELVTPIARCGGGGGGPTAPACSNGLDDDGDGMADARDSALTQPTDPDPGCSGSDDATESSEIAPPAGCDIRIGVINEDDRFPGTQVSGCGAITGVWLKPTASPLDCAYLIGGTVAGCDVTGATAGADFAATTAQVILGTHTATVPPCGKVTVALTLADGRVAAARGDWC